MRGGFGTPLATVPPVPPVVVFNDFQRAVSLMVKHHAFTECEVFVVKKTFCLRMRTKDIDPNGGLCFCQKIR